MSIIFHAPELERISQDEARLTCPMCDYVRAVKLTLDGRVDGYGKLLVPASLGIAHPWIGAVYESGHEQ